MSITIYKNFLKLGIPAHPEPVEGASPLMPVPAKAGNPHGKTYPPLHPDSKRARSANGVPNLPECGDEQYERERMVREWLERLT